MISNYDPAVPSPTFDTQNRLFAADFRSAGCLATLKRFVLVLGALTKPLLLQATNAYPSDQ